MQFPFPLRLVFIVATLALPVAPAAAGSSGEAHGAAAPEGAIRATVASALPANHAALMIYLEKFQSELDRRLSEAGAPAIAWRPAHEGLLAQDGGVLEAVEDNLAAFGIVSVDAETERLPLQNITQQLPFTTERCEVVAKAYHATQRTVAGMDGPFNAARQRYLAPIAADEPSFAGIIKITNAGEVRGRPIGMTAQYAAWLDGVQAIPVRMPEVSMADRLESQSLFAVLMPASDVVRLRLRPVAEYFTDTGFGSQVSHVVTVNARWYAAQPDAVRTAIDETAGAFVVAGAEAYCAAGRKAREKLRASEVRSASLLRSRREQWVAALPPLGWEWARANDAAGRPGTVALSDFVARLEKAGVTFLRDWTSPSTRVVAAGE